jgi:hypothetical protein
MADNIQVRDASGTLLTMRTQDVGGVHTPYQRVMGYDAQDDMLKVKSVQKKFRDSFPGSSLNAANWDSSIGSGGSVSVTAGTLVMSSGANASVETSVLSKETFTVPFRVGFQLTMSQRIANQTFLVEAVSVNATTGVPDGLHSAAWLFDGTTVTQAKYRVQNSGVTPLDSAASTVVTTAGTGVYELEPFADEVWFHSSVLDTTNGRSNSYRRHQQIPDPNALYKIRLRWINGATPPASTTTATLQYVACQDYAELTAEITAGRGQSVAGQALAVAVTTMPTVAANATSQDNIYFNDSTTAQAASATLTGTSRDVGIAAGSVHRYSAFNASAFADQAGTLRIECSNDNTTWRRATADTAVAANAVVYLSVPVMTRYYRAVYVNGATLQTAFMLNTSFTAS